MTATVRGRPLDADRSAEIARFMGSARFLESAERSRAAGAGAQQGASAEMVKELASALVGDLAGG
jgi:hypothetical protein